jgi:hypothetical protein
MDSFENTDTHVPVEPKRRKVRKGTRSCWACKQRKMKCILNPLTDTICNGCRRRGLKCVSQEYPDTSLPGMGTTFDARTSTMPSEDGRKTDDILTPVSMGSDSLRYLTSSRVRILKNISCNHVTVADCFLRIALSGITLYP